jgi:ribulose-phosphate 3-epimerase
MTLTQPYQLAASLVCANMLDLEGEITKLNKGGADMIHFDVMDGQFVPRYGLHPEILQAIRSKTDLPIDVHMMVENPEDFIQIFADWGAQYYAVHVEACPQLHRTLTLIKKAGMKAGVALNPATPLSVLDHILDDIDLIVLMAINPGIVGHPLIPHAMEKISQAKACIGARPILLEVDGGVTPLTAQEMIERGAAVLVCGSSTIFRPHEAPVDKKLIAFRKSLDNAIRV